MKKWTLIGLIGVVVLWALGGWWYLPRVEGDLVKNCGALLRAPEHLGIFDQVTTKASGQHISLIGKVATEADKSAAEALVRSKLRAPTFLASGLSPILELNNGIQVDASLDKAHPRPWLLAMLMPNGVTLTGVMTEAERTQAVTALTAKLTKDGQPPITTLIEANAASRPSTNLSATLSAIPDLASAAAGDSLKTAAATTLCDGAWNGPQLGSAGMAGIVATLGSAGGALAYTALEPLNQAQIKAMEEARVAALPASTLAFAFVGKELIVHGAVGDKDTRDRLVKALITAYPGVSVNTNGLTLSDAVKPGADFTAALLAAPKVALAGGTLFALSATGVPAVWDGKGGVEEAKKALLAAGTVDGPAAAAFASMESARNAAAAAEAKAKADAEAAKAKAEADAKMKSEAEAQAKAKAEADAKAKATAPTIPSPGTPKNPGYLGWTVSDGVVSLFGAVQGAAQKAAAVAAAQAAFPGLKVVADALAIDPTREVSKVAFPEKLDPKTATFGVINAAGVGSALPADAFDSEIAAKLPGVQLTEGELSKSLTPFRAALVKGGKLAVNEPYLSLMSDGKTLTVQGEVADEATKKQVLDALKAANAGVAVTDKLAASPLVAAAKGDLKKTLASLPKFEAGKAMVAMTKPGEAFRAGVVHAIYFQTGSSRSIDQDRAIAQIRRVLAANPSATFSIEGNSDNVGKDEDNQKLSQQRAENAIAFFTSLGIDKGKFAAKGNGPSNPIADNATPEGRALNRRVDVLLK